MVYVKHNSKKKYLDSFEAVPKHEEPIDSKVLKIYRLTRERQSSMWHSEYISKINVAYYLLIEDEELSTFHEDLKCSNVALWMIAM